MRWDNEKIENAFLSVGVADAASDAYDEAIAAAQIMRDDYEKALGEKGESCDYTLRSAVEVLKFYQLIINKRSDEIAALNELHQHTLTAMATMNERWRKGEL